jgi:Glycosyl transferase 4-like domain
VRTVRVLHLGFEDPAMPGAGGGSVRTHEINRRLVARGHEVTVLTTRFPGCADASRTASPTCTSGRAVGATNGPGCSATCRACRSRPARYPPTSLHSAPDPAFLAAHGLRRWVSPDDPVEKRKLIEGYRTQVDALFPGGRVPPRAEEYYTRA